MTPYQAAKLQFDVISNAIEKERTVEFPPDTALTPEQRDTLRTVSDSLMFAMNAMSRGHNDDATSDLMFAHSKISELLNAS